MRVRIPIAPCLIVALCAAVAAFGWYEGRPQHILVQGTLGSGTDSRVDPSAPVVWSHASLETAGGYVWVDIHAQVRDVRGATIRCTLEGYPGAGGTKVLTGGSPPSTTVAWQSIDIDRTTWLRSVLRLGAVPKYTLDYSPPRPPGWRALGVLAILAGPILAGAWWAAAILRRITAERRRGFEIMPTHARSPDL